VAFVGKTHFVTVHNATCDRDARIQTVDIGKQTAMPPAWPFPKSTEVWVLPSTSGASALTNADREEPFFELAAKLKNFPWPDQRHPTCKTDEEAPQQDA